MGEGESKCLKARHHLSGEAAPSGACAAARALSAAADLGDVDTARLCILVEELVMNVVEHGGALEVYLSFAVVGRSIRIELIDGGASFDPRTVTPASKAKDRGGGAGLAIIQAWADLLSYRSKDGLNRTRLVMPLQS